MNEITLETLINEYKTQFVSLEFYNGYYHFPNQQQYEKWLAKTQRYLSTYYTKDQQALEFNSLSRGFTTDRQQERMLAILEALTLLPTPIPEEQSKEESNSANDGLKITINNNNNQTQNQEQSLAVGLFLDAIRDDLTGRQIKELKSVVAESDNDLEKARTGILTKIKEFGTDVASNIVANILTNPMIWGGL